ncbi:MAG TPA: ABC transporter substrate-binding protein [Candidatus Nanoarchaeia archaeon]|nr:ABC transporter substrate-binding protein [Candidatus Nanoarchaeia archaeon]
MRLHLLIGILLVLSSCSGSQDEIVIGAILPLNGDLASLGESAQHALELAVEDNPGIRLIVEDEGNCDTKLALSATQKLISIDHVDALIGPICAGPFKATQPVTTTAEIPHFGPIMNQGLIDDGNVSSPYAIGLLPPPKMIWKRLAEHAITLGAKIAIINAIDGGSELNVQNFVKRFNELGGEVVFHEKVPIGTRDFRTTITKIDQTDALVWPHLFRDDRIAFYAQVEELAALEDQTILGDLYIDLEPQKYIDALGPLLEGAVLTNFKQATSPEFLERFTQRYGEAPALGADNSYDSLMLAVRGIKECGDDAACVIRSVKEGPYSGASGLLAFDENGERAGEVSVKTIINGTVVITG